MSSVSLRSLSNISETSSQFMAADIVNLDTKISMPFSLCNNHMVKIFKILMNRTSTRLAGLLVMTRDKKNLSTTFVLLSGKLGPSRL
ncbi:unnamed protein product [Arabis nemorensis]|uniref:Uncharacterized protein n=1 Tax=Arabis nemorensis TaxID=586526 RepID=A0A565AU87_9BRAS|nr:unnamed protein product [Arabis nemorensis]